MSPFVRSVLTVLLLASAADAQSFSQARIGQNTPLARGSNRLTVTLVTDTSLTASSAITLSGLGTASSPSGTTVNLLASVGGNGAEQLFNSQAAWNSAGSLMCTVGAGKTMSAGTSYRFAFVLLNPPTSQQGQQVTVEASGSATIPQQVMSSDNGDVEGVSGGRAPLLTVVPAFRTAFITQTTPLVEVYNYIIIFLQANANIARGSRIYIAGLNATSSTEGETPEGCSAPANFKMELFPHGQLFGLDGCIRWTQSSGLMEWTVQTDLRGSDTYQIVFALVNPPKEQPSPRVRIWGEIENILGEVRQANGYRAASLPAQDFYKDDTTTFGVLKGANVLYIVQNYMMKQTIQQDFSLAEGDNTMTITLTSFTNMPRGSRITISGLGGSSTPSTASLPLSVSNSFVRSTAVWDQQQGKLEMETVGPVVGTGLPAWLATVVTFTLRNDEGSNRGGLLLLDGFVETSSGDTFNPLSQSPMVPRAMVTPNAPVLGIPNGTNPLTYLPWYACPAPPRSSVSRPWFYL
jgi:hypothetical protein